MIFCPHRICAVRQSSGNLISGKQCREQCCRNHNEKVASITRRDSRLRICRCARCCSTILDRPKRKEPATMSLKGKVALVTGSTSGIGQGIAVALAEAGADIMLNGFGNASQIEDLRAGVAAQNGVRVAYSGADISKPE